MATSPTGFSIVAHPSFSSERPKVRKEFNFLPDPVILHIWQHLDARGIIGIQRVCKKWTELPFPHKMTFPFQQFGDHHFVRYAGLRKMRTVFDLTIQFSQYHTDIAIYKDDTTFSWGEISFSWQRDPRIEKAITDVGLTALLRSCKLRCKSLKSYGIACFLALHAKKQAMP